MQLRKSKKRRMDFLSIDFSSRKAFAVDLLKRRRFERWYLERKVKFELGECPDECHFEFEERSVTGNGKELGKLPRQVMVFVIDTPDPSDDVMRQLDVYLRAASTISPEGCSHECEALYQNWSANPKRFLEWLTRLTFNQIIADIARAGRTLQHSQEEIMEILPDDMDAITVGASMNSSYNTLLEELNNVVDTLNAINKASKPKEFNPPD